RYTRRKEWVERPREAGEWIAASLRAAGFERVADGEPRAGCDAVVLHGDEGPVSERAAALRAAGLGVAGGARPREDPVTERMHLAVRRAMDAGCARFAIYGIGEHTRRSAAILDRGLPIVGFIDDGPAAPRALFGLPVVPVDRALDELGPDAVLLSS